MLHWLKNIGRDTAFVFKIAFLICLNIFSLSYAIEIALMAVEQNLYPIEWVIVLFGSAICASLFIWSTGVLWKELIKPQILYMKESVIWMKEEISKIADEWDETKEAFKQKPFSIKASILFIGILFIGILAGIIIFAIGAIVTIWSLKANFMSLALAGIVIVLICRALIFFTQIYIDHKLEEEKTPE